jgi:hypothetical protein
VEKEIMKPSLLPMMMLAMPTYSTPSFSGCAPAKPTLSNDEQEFYNEQMERLKTTHPHLNSKGRKKLVRKALRGETDL